ncbi:MAG TPA: hypothetical protein VM029_20810 [Opitutaceae bacterium]|nr:hypothetical protein [Opitutaceae bacterium]
MTLTDLRRLHQKIVLVKSSRDGRNPPTGRRGTIEVHDDPDPRARGAALVQIALDFPQMFTTRAHHRTITLDAAAIERLIASERNGTYELTIDEPLDPDAPETLTAQR